MIKKVAILFAVVIVLTLSVTYVASGSSNSASQSLPELPDRSAAVSGLSGSYHTLMAVDPCEVDFNGSGTVDVGDIMLVANCWRSTDSGCDPYDLNSDGVIDVADIMLVAAQWGNTCGTPTPTPTSTPTSTPTPTPTATSTPGAPVPPLDGPGLAIDMGGQDTNPTRRDLAAAAGFRLHRTSVSWASVEPNNVDLTNPANGNWPDSTFNIYRNDRRLIPYVIVMNNPSWAAQKACGPIYASRLDEFGEFVGQLVARYADVTPYWVFYNEEDQWTTVPHDAGGCWGGYGAEYAQMLAVAWDAAHDANSYAQVIFGAAAYEPAWDEGNTWDRFFFRDAFQYMQGNPDDYVDIIAANQYNFRRDDWDSSSSTLPENQEIIAKFYQAVSDAGFNPNNPDTPAAYSVYKWQTAYGLDVPMATGEVGEQVSLGCGGDVQKCEELQARQAVHVNVRGMAAGLKIICWYTLVDKPGGLKYGLLRSANESDARPSYYAYQVLAQQLDGYEFDQQLVVAGKPRIQAYRFDQGGVKKLVLWRDSGEKIKSQDKDATETMTVSATELGTGWTGRVRVTDKLGNSHTEYGSSSVYLTFSSDPIYVEAY